MRYGQNILGLNPADFAAFLLNTTAKAHFIVGIMTLKFPRISVF